MAIQISKLISLGPNCHTAGVLQKLNYKKESYPFDWKITDLDIFIDCIDTDFVHFLDKIHYFKNENFTNKLIIGHKMYKDTFFIHRNPLHINTDYQYEVRCVNRFKDLKNGKDILFVHTVYNNGYDKNKLIQVKQKLDNHCNTAYLLILNYNIQGDSNKDKTTCEYLDNGIYTININISYDPTIEYSLDKAIMEYYDLHNPIKEIFNIHLESTK
jgi:hypothetical protein